MVKNPKVSIVIPVYNGSDYMRYAIDCAISQTYENKEIIVVNDGSTDNGKTEEIALSYGDQIRYFSKPNGGVSSALNYGISKMEGEYFSWLSHDDEYTPDKLKDSIELLLSRQLHGKKCIVYTDGYIMDAGGTKIKDFHRFFQPNRHYSGYEVINVMTRKGTLYGCCMLIPRAAFDEVGGFDETLRYSQDALMWYRIFMAGYDLVSDGRPNVMCRMHQNQVSQRRKDLFYHDSLVIAKMLAESFCKIDPAGRVLLRYIKRLSKYQCVEAIRYMHQYGIEKGCLTWKDSLMILLYRFVGFFRNKLVLYVKKILLLIWH